MGGGGIWHDDENYCQDLLSFISASSRPENFRFSDDGQIVSLQKITEKSQKIQGNFFIRTELGSKARFCGVFNHGYYALACSRVISAAGKPEIFASVYNQTLKDMKACLGRQGWKQVGVDQGACLPRGTLRGECIRVFEKGSRAVWLFSNLEQDGSRYTLGIQTVLGP